MKYKDLSITRSNWEAILYAYVIKHILYNDALY